MTSSRLKGKFGLSFIKMVLRKITQEYATHTIPLACDIYTPDDAPKDAPVFLYFHPGGLVGGSRQLIAPWLVQVRNPTPLFTDSHV